MSTTPLASFPPVDAWDDWMEYDAAAWPKKVERKYMLVPTTCFNCEAACGLMAYVDKASMQVRRLEGNPHHPGSRGKNCAKGPATINQINDPQRILHPLKRAGPRGSGRFERTTWDEVLDTFAARIRQRRWTGPPRSATPPGSKRKPPTWPMRSNRCWVHACRRWRAPLPPPEPSS